MSNKTIPEAEALLNKQLEMSSKTKKSDLITLIIFCLLVIVPAVAFWVIPDKQTSYEEKRALKQLPEISVQRILEDAKYDISQLFTTIEEKEESGEKREVLSDEIAEYYADQFPMRNTLRVIKAGTELALGKRENNGVIFSSDGHLVKKDTLTDNTTSADAIDTIKKNALTLKMLDKYLDSVDSKLIFALAGRGVDVMESKLPSFYPYDDATEIYWDTLNKSIENSDYTYVDLRTPLTQKNDDGEYVYYRTDHHFTTLGGYYAYVEIMKSLGQSPLDIDSFKIEKVTDEFFGTVYAKAGYSPKGGDEINLFRFDGDEDFTTRIELGSNVTEYNGFYNLKYLDSADKYSLFLGHEDENAGGNSPITYITKNTDEQRKTLVIIKDSFANTVAPFLAYHYDLVILDMRSYQPGGENKTVVELASDEETEGVLVLYNMETFMNDNSSLYSTLIK